LISPQLSNQSARPFTHYVVAKKKLPAQARVRQFPFASRLHLEELSKLSSMQSGIANHHPLPPNTYFPRRKKK